MVMIRVPQVGSEAGTSLSAEAQKVEDALDRANLGKRTREGAEIVGATVGQELTRKGILATVLSLVGILFYLAFRFQFSFGVGAVVATIHDLLITLAFLAFFRYDMSLNVIAAILTMTGFSTNDTIVIFDRIRENLRSMRRDSMNHVINESVNQTLTRTVIASGTALLTALALFFFGGEVLHGFAFTMVVGIITGTYSSVFIAAAIVSLWRGDGPDARRRSRPGHRRRGAGAAAAAETEASEEGTRVLARAGDSSGGIARRRAGNHRVPASVESRPSRSWRGCFSASTGTSSAWPLTWHATSGRCSRSCIYFREEIGPHGRERCLGSSTATMPTRA